MVGFLIDFSFADKRGSQNIEIITTRERNVLILRSISQSASSGLSRHVQLACQFRMSVKFRTGFHERRHRYQIISIFNFGRRFHRLWDGDILVPPMLRVK